MQLRKIEVVVEILNRTVIFYGRADLLFFFIPTTRRFDKRETNNNSQAQTVLSGPKETTKTTQTKTSRAINANGGTKETVLE